MGQLSLAAGVHDLIFSYDVNYHEHHDYRTFVTCNLEKLPSKSHLTTTSTSESMTAHDMPTDASAHTTRKYDAG